MPEQVRALSRLSTEDRSRHSRHARLYAGISLNEHTRNDRDGRNNPAMTLAASLRAHAGGFDHLFRHFAVLDDLGGKGVRRISGADQAAVFELLLREFRFGDDRGDLLGK